MNRMEQLKECDRKIIKHMRNMYAIQDATTIRFKNPIVVECEDNHGKKTEEHLIGILYDKILNMYEIRNIYGQRVPFSCIQNPEKIIKELEWTETR